MEQTAIEWLKKELEDYGSNSHLSLGWNTFDELFEQAKEMEKQQQGYTEEEVKFIISEALQSALVKVDLEQWFNQFHKKK
jgi:hypothetical protein